MSASSYNYVFSMMQAVSLISVRSVRDPDSFAELCKRFMNAYQEYTEGLQKYTDSITAFSERQKEFAEAQDKFLQSINAVIGKCDEVGADPSVFERLISDFNYIDTKPTPTTPTERSPGKKVN